MLVPQDRAGGKVKSINMDGFSTQHSCAVNKADFCSWHQQHSCRNGHEGSSANVNPILIQNEREI